MDKRLGLTGLVVGQTSADGPSHLRPYRSTPGGLARRMDLSSGAMTNRLDRLETAGLIRRLPAPDDRRRVVVELTDHGREKAQLDALLRQLMLEFERREQKMSDVERD